MLIESIFLEGNEVKTLKYVVISAWGTGSMNDFILEEIAKIAEQYGVERVLLYGSRARGNHSPVSDYDIAIYGKHISTADRVSLSHDIDEIRTLKKIDLVFLTDIDDTEFAQRIREEGVIIYEQICD